MITQLNLELQNQLAKKIQARFPILERPFEVLAKELSLTEKEVINQIKDWIEKKYLREISAIIEGEVFDFESALVGAKINMEDLNKIVDFLKEHPMITHLYLRNHTINLWFTISVEKEIGLENHLKQLSEITKYHFYSFKRTNTYKIGVNFDFISKKNQTEKKELKEIEKFPKTQITEKIKQIIRAIQTPLPIIERPFKKLAEDFDLKEEEIINFLQNSPYGAVRKYVATFHHRNLGVVYNAMVVWKIPEKDLDTYGVKFANYPEISHCYARTYTKEFPYNLYTMIHGPEEATVKQIVKKISEDLKIDHYLILYSPIEYKKTRLRYFTKEWEIFLRNLSFYTNKFKF